MIKKKIGALKTYFQGYIVSTQVFFKLPSSVQCCHLLAVDGKSSLCSQSCVNLTLTWPTHD